MSTSPPMDVDEQSEPEPWHSDTFVFFELSPEGFAWQPPKPQEIESRRAKMSDVLIFDILLSSGGIREADTLYPPSDVPALRRLIDAIQGSTYDILKKDCLVYYLMKFHDDRREVGFVDERCIPPQFVALAEAYWCLDMGVDVRRAVELLSDARLNRDYPSKILQAISLESNPNPLILQYVRTAKPRLTEPDDMDIYIVALVDSSLMEAWQFQRTFPERSETRRRLLMKILYCVLSPHPRPTPLTHLLSLPFSNYEQSLVHSYALKPPDALPESSVTIIQDLVCVRLVRSGEYAAAIKLDRQFALSSMAKSQTDGQAITNGIAEKVGRERRKMLDEVMSLMPDVERQMLEEELEDLSLGKVRPSGSRLSMSWEHLRPAPDTARGVSTPGARRSSGMNSAPTAVPASRNLFTQIHTPARNTGATAQGYPSPSLFPPILKTSRQPQIPIGQPGPSGLRHEIPSIGLGRPSHPSNSLFSSTGSANMFSNAFYKPPASYAASSSVLDRSTERRVSTTSTNGVKRTFGEVSPRATGDRSLVEAGPSSSARLPNGAHPPSVEDDVTMDSGYDPSNEQLSDEQSEAAPSEFPMSIFSSSTPGPSGSGVRDPYMRARTSSRRRMPPGAFDAYEDMESPEPERATLNGNGNGYSNGSASGTFGRPSPPPSPPTPVKRTRTRSNKPSAPSKRKDVDLGRSLPGTLMLDGDDDEEEEDTVPPLPPLPKPATRKGRTSKASSVGDDEEDSSVRPRRSARLSVASSDGSPEPPSRQRKSNKASGTSGKTGTRRKR